MTVGRVALAFAVAAPTLILSGLFVPDPWPGTANGTVSSTLLLSGLAAAGIAFALAPVALTRSTAGDDPRSRSARRSSIGAYVVLAIAAAFFGLLLLAAYTIDWQ